MADTELFFPLTEIIAKLFGRLPRVPCPPTMMVPARGISPAEGAFPAQSCLIRNALADDCGFRREIANVAFVNAESFVDRDYRSPAANEVDVRPAVPFKPVQAGYDDEATGALRRGDRALESGLG